MTLAIVHVECASRIVDRSVYRRLAVGAVVTIETRTAFYVVPFPSACPDLNSGPGLNERTLPRPRL